MAKNDPIPLHHELMRWIKKKYLAKKDSGEIEVDEVGVPSLVFPQAFELREDEEFLSLTSVNFYEGDGFLRIFRATEGFRQTMPSGNLNLKSAFAFAVSEEILETCERFGHRVRILEDPDGENIGHVALRRFPKEMSELHTVFASETFRRRFIYDFIRESAGV